MAYNLLIASKQGSINTSNYIMKKLIYVLEDDEDIRDILSIFFSDFDLEVKTFEDIKGFKKMMETSIPDLYILDINLPDGNGLDLADHLAATDSTRNIPILLMSAHMNTVDITNSKFVSGFIQKPFDLYFMKNKVMELLAAS